jgi:hypothetical protein
MCAHPFTAADLRSAVSQTSPMSANGDDIDENQ